MDHPLFINISTVKIFPQTVSQAKKHVLRGAQDPQNDLSYVFKNYFQKL